MPWPEQPKRMPHQAVLIGSVHRGNNVYGDDLIDRYFLARMQAGKYWVLWVCFVDHSDYEGRVVRVPIKWCLTKGLQAKSAAAAMLQATWQEDELFNDWDKVDEDTTIEEEGLLSASEIEEILRRALAAKAEPGDAADGGRDPGS
jgi:hypothetical protein